MSVYTFRVVFDPARCSQNTLRTVGHWTRQRDLIHAARRAGFYAWIDAGKPVSRTKCRVSALIVRRGRRFDPMNCHGAIKPILDGILCGFQGFPALLPDDSVTWVEAGEVTQQPLAKGSLAREACVIVTVEELLAVTDADGRAGE